MPFDSAEFEDWTAIDPAIKPKRRRAVKPDIKIAKEFWSAFSPDDPSIRLRFLKHDRTAPAAEVYADSIEAIWPKVVELQAAGYECYYFVNRIPAGSGHGWRGAATDDDVLTIRAIATDHDDEVPELWHLAPDIIVLSSKVDGKQRGQALWLVQDCAVDQFTTAQERLVAHYTSDRNITTEPPLV